MRLLVHLFILATLWLPVQAPADDVSACTIENLARLSPNFNRKLYRPLFSTNVETLKMMKVNKTYPAPNMFLMPPEKWFAPDAEFKEQMELRHRLYANRPQDIFVVEPSEEARVLAASEEMFGLVTKHLLEKFPETYEAIDGRIHIKPIGKSFLLNDHSDLHPLAKLALMVQDDITISLVAPNDGPVTMYGGFLATPTHWSMQDFNGMAVHEIHSGIAGYEEKLKKTVQGAVTAHGGRIMGRNNWFIEANPELALPSYRTSTYKVPEVTDHNVAETLHLRSEWESIFVLPNTKAAAFTIRPRVWSLPRVKEDAPEIAQQLSEALPTSQYAGEYWVPALAKYLNTGVVAPPPERPAGPPPGVRPAEGFASPPPSAPAVPAAPPAPPAPVEPEAPVQREPQSIPDAMPAQPAPPLIPEADEPPTR